MKWRLAAVVWLAGALWAQTVPGADGHRMEIMLDRLDGASWRAIDPGLVLERSDRVRFRFRTNFDGYLYVLNQSTSGKYEQLFPRQETGQDNRVEAGKEYQVPATSSVFRIAGPAGHEIVYWLVRRRLGREVAGIFGVAPEVALAHQFEPGGLDLAAQCTFLDPVKRSADRDAITGSS